MSRAKKIILYDESGYGGNRDAVLRPLFDDRIELFCTVGIDAMAWADCMSWICTMADVDEGIDHFVAISWHPSDTLDEVIEFARNISISGEDKIEIIRM